MAADGRNEAGVLGNLPRSRPGRRSTKRVSLGAAAQRAAAAHAPTTRASAAARRAEPPDGPTAERAGAARSGASVPGQPRSDARSRPATTSGRAGSDPFGSAVRLASKIAGAGVRIAVGVLKKFPGA